MRVKESSEGGEVPFYKLFWHADWVDCMAMGAGALAAIVHGASLPVFLVFLGRLIDALGTSQGADMSREVCKYALYFVYLSLARFASGWIEVSMWLYTGERQSARIRTGYVKALISQEVGFFDTEMSTGEVVTSISTNTALVQDAIGAKTGNLVHFSAQFIAGMVVAFTSVWQLTLVTLAVIPVIMLCGGFYAYAVVACTTKSQKAYVRAGEVAHEVISQIRTVQLFVREDKAFQLYKDALQATKRLGKQVGLVKGAGIGSIYGMGFASFGLLLWFAGRLVRNRTTTGGQAFTTILNVIASSISLGQAAPNVATISKAKVAGYAILEMLKRKSLIVPNDENGLKLEQINGTIELRDICFSYPARPDIDIFQKFSLTIPAGKMVAIVGGSGAGKSTVISLIERFYDPISGEVLLDGHNIKSMQLEWLRDQMGLVNQEPALFATTIQENIKYGKKGEVSLDEVIKAASLSCANEFIDALPKHYETQVGERGIQLSGGQKQRIAIARAMLKNPSILLLDEATTALDSDSEKSVQKALDQAMLGRTTVVVAHRLSTVQSADLIAFVQDGKVVELGSHRELIEEDGSYAALVKIQNAEPSGFVSSNSQRSVSQELSRFGSRTDRAYASESSMNQVELIADDISVPSPYLLRLMKMNDSEWPYGLLGGICAVFAGVQTPIFALIITQALEYFFSPDVGYMKKGLAKTSLYCCGAGAVAVFAYLCANYFAGIMGENITLRVRKAMFSAILQNEIGWFDQNSSTLLAASLSADAPSVKTAFVDCYMSLLQTCGMVVAAFVITIKLQWKIALITFSTFPALVGAQIGQIRFTAGFNGDLNNAYIKANAVAGEAVSNIRTVAAFSAEEKMMGLFHKELSKMQVKSFVRGQIGGIIFGLSQCVQFCSYGLSLWYGSGLIRRGEATFGETMKCYMVLIITASGVAESFNADPSLWNPKAMQRVVGILDRVSKMYIRESDAEEFNLVNGAIEFRRVNFSYPSRPDAQILNNFNLKVEKGRSQALVGASGSGKSSVISLIVRFYDPQSGKVLLDGKDIKHLRLQSIRQHIGLVQQEPVLFSTSIYDNIRYGKEEATEAEIVEAAKAANAHSFICRLPEGYKTEVGERGVQLSGGQKQRVAIARAVLKDPTILLLDEATSALDVETERLVQDALNKLMKRRTTIVVAHRLSTIKTAHSIAVLETGSIKEQGNHHNLLAKRGAYFQLLSFSDTYKTS